jgi:hypothetical protein
MHSESTNTITNLIKTKSSAEVIKQPQNTYICGLFDINILNYYRQYVVNLSFDQGICKLWNKYFMQLYGNVRTKKKRSSRGLIYRIFQHRNAAICEATSVYKKGKKFPRTKQKE